MKKELYFAKMRDTAEKVIPIIVSAYKDMEHPDRDSLNIFLKKRTKPQQCLLRPFLVRIGYEFSGKCNWESIILACAAIEVFNISTYQSNIAFDSKNSTNSDSLKSNQFVCAMISLNKSIQLIYSMENIPKEIICKIIKRIHEVNNDIYFGQSIDINDIHISKIDLSMSIEEYLHNVYFKRCNKLGGSLTSLCLEIGAMLGNINDEIIDKMKTIGMLFGTAGQILNDLADFIEIDKSNSLDNYKEVFSDIKNGKVTLPIFIMLKRNDDHRNNILDILSGVEEIDERKKEIILMHLFKSDAIINIKNVIREYYKNIKKEINQIHEINDSIAINLLSMSVSGLMTNKYFATLREI